MDYLVHISSTSSKSSVTKVCLHSRSVDSQTQFLVAGLNNMLVGFPSKDATALCTFAYSKGPGHEPILFEGKTEGRIVSARGPSNFGWDPVFEVEDTGKT